MERNLEKETGNRTENEKCWHRICLLHRLMCSVFLYCALDYLAMVMSLQCEKKSVVLTHFGYLSSISFSASHSLQFKRSHVLSESIDIEVTSKLSIY